MEESFQQGTDVEAVTNKMEKEKEMNSFIILLLILHIIPFLITQLILCDHLREYNKEWKKKVLQLGTLLNLSANFMCLFFAYAFVYDIRNPFHKIANIISLQCSYQDVGRLGTVLVFSAVIAILTGTGGYFLFNKELPEFSKGKISLLLLVVLILFIPVIGSWKVSYQGRWNLKISQICRKTTVELGNSYRQTEETDEDGSYVVIRNIGSLAYELDKMHLCDKENDEEGLLIQNVTIGAGEEYQYNMASDDGMNIKKQGGTIVYLTDESGMVLDQVTVPALERNESYTLDGEEWKVVSFAVEEEETVTVPAPEFSAESGFYEKPFDLSISAESGLQIYYTVDSSNPTEKSEIYTSPIYIYDKSQEPNQYRSIQNVQRSYLEHSPIGQTPVDKCFVVRAVAVDQEGNRSDVVTQSYFIGLDKYQNQNVISLVSDPDDLFGDEGIYVTGLEYDQWYEAALANTLDGEEIDTTDRPTENYLKRGIDWERLANFELFDTGQLVNNQLVGIRIQGASNRAYALKRFSIYSREEYSGSKWFNADFFEGIKSHSVVLRNGDANAISQHLASNRSALNILGESTVLFLDGEYWYNSYLYEKLSEKYFAEHYGVSEDNIILAREGTTITENIESKYTFEYLADYVKYHDLTEEDNYIELQQMMDIQSYIDYWIINIYLANMDVSEGKNIVAWRTVIKEDNHYGDQKWRWVFYDMDLLTQYNRGDADTDAEVNSFNIKSKYVANAIDEGTFWKALTVRPDFCQQFVLSFMDIANTNFSLSNVEQVLEEYGYDISYDDYFFQERPKYIFQYLAEEFGLTGTQETVKLISDRTGTPIKLNTITPELSADGTWSGTYFTDYPVTATVTADGFDHWEVTSAGKTAVYTDTTIEVPVAEGGVEIYAVFK